MRAALAFALVALAVVATACTPPARAEEPAPATVADDAPRRVAVTVDDLPFVGLGADDDVRRETTAALLQCFAAHDVPVVGFVNEGKLYDDGELVAARVALLEQWLDAGHELGNHTFSHPSLHRVDIADYEADIVRGEPVLRRLHEARDLDGPRWFRHPMLHTGESRAVRERIAELLRERGYRVAPVTIDNDEWIFARAWERTVDAGDEARAAAIGVAYLEHMAAVTTHFEALAEQVVSGPVDHVLLLHANRLNARYCDDVLGQLAARGYTFVSLDEALAHPAYREQTDGYRGPRGVSWLQRWALGAGLAPDDIEAMPRATDEIVEAAEL